MLTPKTDFLGTGLILMFVKLCFVYKKHQYFATIYHVKLKIFLALKHSTEVFIMLINVKMSTTVGILTFMILIKPMLE